MRSLWGILLELRSFLILIPNIQTHLCWYHPILIPFCYNRVLYVLSLKLNPSVRALEPMLQRNLTRLICLPRNNNIIILFHSFIFNLPLSIGVQLLKTLKSHPLKISLGLPWWRSGWESACQCRGHGFRPWSGRIPHAAEQLGPCATTAEPVL